MLHDDGADDVAIVAQMRALRAAAQAASPAKADIALAALLCGQADPIANTAACRYLVEMCGIPAPAEGWPPCVRFHHGQQALVFAGTTTDGDVRGAMLVRLADGHLWVLGDLSDAPVRFPGAEDGPLLLATEPEPGLAAWAATGYELHLAPLKYLKPPTGRRVVLCRADDKPWLPPDRRVRESVNAWRKAGVDLMVASPWPERRGNGTTLADAVQSDGTAVVAARLNAAIAPPPLPPRVPVGEAGQRLDEVVKKTVVAAAGYTATRDQAVAKARTEGRAQAKAAAPADLKTARDARTATIAAGRVVRQARGRKIAIPPGRPKAADRQAILAARKAARQELADANIAYAAARAAKLAAWEFVSDEDRKQDRKTDRDHIKTAVAAALEKLTPPPVHAIRSEYGLGKSSVTRRHITDLLLCVWRLAEALLQKHRRGTDRKKKTIVVAVPTHELADEAASAFRKMPAVVAAGLTAGVWRGREAPDPAQPGKKMCLDLDRVRDAQAACASIQSSCCKTKSEVCPFHGQCGYQKNAALRPDIWFAAHEVIFRAPPAAFGNICKLVVDESCWQDGLIGVDQPLTISLDTLRALDVVPGSQADTEELRHRRHQALQALDHLPDGAVPREAFVSAGLNAAAAANAARQEWMRYTDPGMTPGMTQGERKAARRAAEGNRTIKRLVMFWNALAALLRDNGPDTSGWIALEQGYTDDGLVRALRLMGRANIADRWQVPTLMLDANFDIDLVRPFCPNVVQTADIPVDAPHQRVVQVTDVSFSKRRLLANEDDDEPDDADAPPRQERQPLAETEKKRRNKNLRDLHAFIAAIGRRYAPGRVLVVVQKQVEEALLKLSTLPPNIELAHHNAVAGIDRWRDVPALVVVGRTAPSPANTERLAEALTGRAVTPITGWYPRACVVRHMADGTAQEAKADRHPDPLAEAIRRQICEGELLQIIARPRGINRTADNPVDVFILTDVPLPVPVNRALTVDDLNPTPTDLMLAAGGIAFDYPADAAAAYPPLWATRAAAESALRRARSASNPNKKYLYGNDAHLPRWIYQRIGPGHRRATALVDPSVTPDPPGAITAKLGELTWCAAVEPEQPVAAPVHVASPVPVVEPLELPLAAGTSDPWRIASLWDDLVALLGCAATIEVGTASLQPAPPSDVLLIRPPLGTEPQTWMEGDRIVWRDDAEPPEPMPQEKLMPDQESPLPEPLWHPVQVGSQTRWVRTEWDTSAWSPEPWMSHPPGAIETGTPFEGAPAKLAERAPRPADQSPPDEISGNPSLWVFAERTDAIQPEMEPKVN